MKGIVLAGGRGTRLGQLTKLHNKHLLPIYDKLMIDYPIDTLVGAGIKDILIVTGDEHAGDFIRYLGDGSERGVKFTYKVQVGEAKGIAHALSLAEEFVGNDIMVVILGDNIIQDSIKSAIINFEVVETTFGKLTDRAQVMLSKVKDPQRYGVPVFITEYSEMIPTTVKQRISYIEEKPKEPKSEFAVIGIYMYGNDVFKKIRELKPSARGELEITDVNNMYATDGKLWHEILAGEWIDAGTVDSLAEAGLKVQVREWRN